MAPEDARTETTMGTCSYRKKHHWVVGYDGENLLDAEKNGDGYLTKTWLNRQYLETYASTNNLRYRQNLAQKADSASAE